MLWQAAFNNVFTLKANSFFLIFTKISNILFKRKGHVDRHWSLYTNITGPSAKTTFNPSFWQQILQSFREMLTIAFSWLKALISGEICNFSWRLRAYM